MKKLIALLLFFTLTLNAQTDKKTAEIATLLDNWHKAAAEANFDSYFSKTGSS